MKKEVKELGQWFDDKIDFTRFVKGITGMGIESVDGFFFTQVLSFAYEKTPEDRKEDLLKLYAAICREDVEIIKTILSTEIVSRIKTSLGDTKESIIVEGVLNIFIELAISK